MKEKEEILIIYNGIAYTEETVDEIWLTLFESSGPFSVNSGGGIYVAEGISVFPDGEMKEW